MRKPLAAVLGTLLLAGCAGSTATSGSPSSAPATVAPASPAPTAAPPSPTAVPAALFTFGKDAVVTTAISGTTDLYVNPGAVIESDGVLHMFANNFSTWPGHMTIPHLTSTDGIAWTLDKDAKALDSDDFKLADPGIDVSTGYLADDGTWILYYETVSATNPWVIGRAIAKSPKGPWTIGQKPVLEGGAAGSFDAGGVQWPSIVKVGDRWAMYYAGFPDVTSRKGAIGVAWSDDGITWTREAEPVLVASEPWELGSLDRPRVVSTPSGLVMLYAGLDLNARGLATSADGRTWMKLPGPNVISAAYPLPGSAWDCALLYRGGQLEYFLEIGPKNTQVFRATLPWP